MLSLVFRKKQFRHQLKPFSSALSACPQIQTFSSFSDLEQADDRAVPRRRRMRHVSVSGALAPAADLIDPLLVPPDAPSAALKLDVSVIGLPNAGKSSLVNQLVKSQISAVSPKINTTRDRVLGVLTQGRRQVVFCDTPGFVEEKLVAFIYCSD